MGQKSQGLTVYNLKTHGQMFTKITGWIYDEVKNKH